MKKFSQLQDLLLYYSPLLHLPREGQELVPYIPYEEDPTIHHAVLLHKNVISSVQKLQAQLQEKFTVQLAIASSYRSIERQILIWEQKLAGLRPVLDQNGKQIDLDILSSYEQLRTISYWSAFPGLSRHHYGTEIDVYDLNALKKNPGYKIQLTEEEYETDGIFSQLGFALEQLSEQNYQRIYWKTALGSVGAEPWHLSFMHQVPDLKKDFIYGGKHHQEISLQFLTDLKAVTHLSLIDALIKHFNEYWQEFIAPYSGQK